MHRRGEGSDVDRHRAGRTRGRPRGPTDGGAGKRDVRRLRADDDRGDSEDAEGGRPGRSTRNARGAGGVRVMREVAWRLFASEYNDATLEMDGGGERAPSYVVTPLGAKVNRVFVVGVITDVENVGTDIQPMWRARVSDPTGTFRIYAGQDPPEPAATPSNPKPPVFRAIAGKSRIYPPQPRAAYT